MTEVTDEFWLERIRRCDSNSAASGFVDLSELISSGRLDSRQLRGVACALRSIATKAADEAALMEDRKKSPWKYRSAA